ncbi:SDR family NAD(P)-dependent oxidoreductase [Mycolicibacterium sp. NCC-Tsukiji]|uniref:SDR family NAD(P)-dependent oxidoreductase n=1 Tax=Mycolicibacterium sp. NCC-Tsukiji TaxID=2185272 RepID=UPI000EED7A4F|nr:SDR family NAD(P)-dependent oxidoreductase [Mycolicibacterium sp. NCC-Tsukiji]GCB00309.1 putative short-chain dehydrogenase/reductase [Mycolicibacterium sp. NCC-Tsukiji]
MARSIGASATKVAKDWLDAHVPDQTGRTVLITGANGGLGAATARHLAAAGAQVILACRRPEQAAALAAEIGPAAQTLHLDLADLDSVKAAAAACGPVNTVVALAGVCHVPYGLTVDGFELHTGINHLGHFALVGHLLDRITDRVVVVTSRAHEFVGRPGFGKLAPADPGWRTRRYSAFDGYCQAKLANLLFANELQRRLTAAGSTVKSVSAQPGWADTDAGMHSGRKWGDVSWRASCRAIGQPADIAALSITYAAAADDVVGGGYYGPDRFFGMRGLPAPAKAGRAATDQALMTANWVAAEHHTGVRYDI